MVIFVFRGFLVLDAMCATKTLQAIPAAPSTSTALPGLRPVSLRLTSPRHGIIIWSIFLDNEKPVATRLKP
jgi:hypothetical protein